MKILLAVDGSTCSDIAVEEIGNRPWPAGSTVKVLNAFELPLAITPEGWAPPPTYFQELDLAVTRQAQNIVEHAIRNLKSKANETISIDGQLLPGPASSIIVDEAESWGADLIVLGSHGYGRWERLLLGAVSQSVMSHAKCSVEVVRCRQTNRANGETDLSKERE